MLLMNGNKLINYSCIEVLLTGICFILWPALLPAAAYQLPEAGGNLVGEIQTTIVNEQDTLLDIARVYGLGFNEITAANPGIDPWLPKAGTQVVLPTQFILPDGPRKGIVVNLAEMRLYYFPETQDGQVEEVITFPIGIGRQGWETPVGEYHVLQKLENPSWTMPTSVYEEAVENGNKPNRLVPPGPDNPLGEFAIQLNADSLLIHGTNMPFSIGMRVSRGCLRLYPEDIRSLVGVVKKGTMVHIVEEPYKVSYEKETLFIEAHEPVGFNKKLNGMNMTPLVSKVIKSGIDGITPIQWDEIMNQAGMHSGVPIAVSENIARKDNLTSAIQLPRPFTN